MAARRIGIIALQHESNTFLQQPTTLEHFHQGILATGAAVREVYYDAHHEVSGFFQGVEKAAMTAVPIFAAAATPSGIITAETARELVASLLAELDRARGLDGLLVAPHGAAVSADQPDLDGYWLSQVRARVGPDVPIVCTLDLHANLSQRMVNACDAIVAYRSNPHLDQRQRGLEAARILARMLRGESKPTMAASFPPVAINIARQETDAPPARQLIERLDAQLSDKRVLSNSACFGFPYADVPEMGSSFVVVTENDPALAHSLADELGNWLVQRRHDFAGDLPSVEDAIDQAMQLEGPVCLLDVGDNVGGGSPADGTIIAEALHRRRGARSLVCINDPQCAEQAQRAGAGAVVNISAGGKSDDLHGAPLQLTARVRSLHDGTFTEAKPRHGGKSTYHMGPSAVIDADSGLTLLLTSQRTPPFSLGMVTSCGLDPREFRILVAKGVNAPIAAYREACRHFIRVNTPGVTSADMTTLPFTRRRRPLFPFEEV